MNGHGNEHDTPKPRAVTDIASVLNGREPGILGEQKLGRFSVLVPIVTMDDGRLGILFEKRASTMRRQAGEICFPGGRMEEGDSSRWETARRETSEELGLPIERIHFLGALDILFGPSAASIHPFAGYLEDVTDMNPNPDEVGEVFVIPLETLRAATPAVHRVATRVELPEDYPFHLIPGGKQYPWRTGTSEHLFYEVEGRVIWGMTARILEHFIELMGVENDVGE